MRWWPRSIDSQKDAFNVESYGGLIQTILATKEIKMMLQDQKKLNRSLAVVTPKRSKKNYDLKI